MSVYGKGDEAFIQDEIIVAPRAVDMRGNPYFVVDSGSSSATVFTNDDDRAVFNIHSVGLYASGATCLVVLRLKDELGNVLFRLASIHYVLNSPMVSPVTSFPVPIPILPGWTVDVLVSGSGAMYYASLYLERLYRIRPGV